jgi:hypothetical protein
VERLLTKLVVGAWANRLEREIELLKASLPAEMPRHETTREYVGPRGLLGGPRTKEDQENPENWREETGESVCLDGLRDLLEEMLEAEDSLAEEVR